MDKIQSKGVSNPSTFWSREGEGSKVETDLIAEFNHPFVQALFMMIGEASCGVVFLIMNWLECRRGRGWKNTHGWKANFCYALTASCDVTATSIMYAGLALSCASVYQMLRGAIIIFTALISVFWLRRRLLPFHWFSVLLVIVGVCVVGVQSLETASAGSQQGLILGIILILVAQAVQSFQVTAQEKLLEKFGTPGLRLVGLEGTFGCILLSLLLIPMNYVDISGLPIENVRDAVVQIQNSPSELPTGHPNWHLPVGNALAVAIGGNIVSIAFFNVAGISITKVLSASHRMVLDSMRTCVVWGVALLLGWETFHLVQLIGFVIMLIGTAAYNEYIRLPFFRYDSDDSAREVCAGCEAVNENSHAAPLKANDELQCGSSPSRALGGA
jgi:multidrug transporter EmrE-like cation transporter